jgi:hypothetical protein
LALPLFQGISSDTKIREQPAAGTTLQNLIKSTNMHQKGRAISDPALQTETYEKLLHLLKHDQSAICCGDMNISFRAHNLRIGKFDYGIAADCKDGASIL